MTLQNQTEWQTESERHRQTNYREQSKQIFPLEIILSHLPRDKSKDNRFEEHIFNRAKK